MMLGAGSAKRRVDGQLLQREGANAHARGRFCYIDIYPAHEVRTPTTLTTSDVMVARVH